MSVKFPSTDQILGAMRETIVEQSASIASLVTQQTAICAAIKANSANIKQLADMIGQMADAMAENRAPAEREHLENTIYDTNDQLHELNQAIDLIRVAA
jgi:methyl-accepting chemotaxis protein